MATVSSNVVDQTYFKQPSESVDQYNSRIASYNSSKSTPAQAALTSAASGAPTMSAPAQQPPVQYNPPANQQPTYANGNQGSVVPSAPQQQAQQQSQWNLSPWTAQNGAWTSQPTLTVNGQSSKYATPQEYITALQGMQGGNSQQLIQELQGISGNWGGTATQQAQQNPTGTVSQTGNPYPQITAGLANTATQGSQAATQAQATLQGLSTQPSQQVQDANKNLLDFQTQYAQQRGLIGLQPIPLQFQQGRQQVIANQYSQQLPAYQTAVQNALTQQGQQVTAAGAAAGAANTQQQNVQSGLSQAGQLAAPIQAPYTNQVISPVSGGSIQGQSPYGTGPAIAANIGSIQDLTTQANNWSAARASATQIGNQLTSFLSTHNVNPSDFNAWNKFLQTIGQNTSSPEYKQFYNLITDLANTYAPVLSVSGDASNYKTQLAQSLLDATAQGQTLPQILGSLDQQAAGKIKGVQDTVSSLQAGQNVNPPASPAAAPWKPLSGSFSPTTGFSW